jgi:hypothetical protein
MADNMTYEDLKEATEGYILRSLDGPMVTPDLPVGTFTPATAPLTLMAVGDNATVHCVDIIEHGAGDIDMPALHQKYKQAIVQKDMSLLPPPFGFKETVGDEVKVQICIITCNDGSKIILKHCVFPKKVKVLQFQKYAYGSTHRLTFAHPKIGVKVWQYVFENMGGAQCRCFFLSPNATNAKGKDNLFTDKADEEIDAGFDFIMKQGPRSAAGMRQLIWMTKTLKNPESPIRGWPAALVEKALRNLSTDGCLAQRDFDWNVTLMHYNPWVLEILEEIWDFDIASLVLLGEPDCGKSPLGRSVLMAQCRHNKTRFGIDGDPCIRVTTEIDFLRGEQGSVLMGDYLDDGNLNGLPMKVVKALLDVGLHEAMAWARWGATKWVANEPRAVADQFYDPGAVTEPEIWPSSTNEQFTKMIRPAFHQCAAPAEIDAVLKRAAFLVNSKTHVYYRKAGVNDDPVPRKCMIKAEYLTPAGKQLYGLYKSGARELPPDHAANVKKEQQWVEAVMKKRMRERKDQEMKDKGTFIAPWTDTPSTSKFGKVTGEVVGSSSSSGRSSSSSGMAADGLVPVKRELVDDGVQQDVLKRTKTWSDRLKGTRKPYINLSASSEEEEGVFDHDE